MQPAFPPLFPQAELPPSRRTGRGIGRCIGRWIVVGLVAVAVLAGSMAWIGIGTYNGLQRNNLRVDYSWHQVVNQYTRRAELVPNLVPLVRSYATHETELFNQIAATHARLTDLSDAARIGRNQHQLAQFHATQTQLSAQFGRLLLVAERYPDLKAANLYQDLMAQLEGTENRLAHARQEYFASLADHNLAIRTFPGMLVAPYARVQERQPVALADDRVVRPSAPLDLR